MMDSQPLSYRVLVLWICLSWLSYLEKLCVMHVRFHLRSLTEQARAGDRRAHQMLNLVKNLMIGLMISSLHIDLSKPDP